MSALLPTIVLDDFHIRQWFVRGCRGHQITEAPVLAVQTSMDRRELAATVIGLHVPRLHLRQIEVKVDHAARTHGAVRQADFVFKFHREILIKAHAGDVNVSVVFEAVHCKYF